MGVHRRVGGSLGGDDLGAHTAGDSQGVDDKEADHAAVGRTGRARNPVGEGHSPAEEAAVEVARTLQVAVLSLKFLRCRREVQKTDTLDDMNPALPGQNKEHTIISTV